MKRASPRIVAIIPARGGSTRLPQKNILEFRGRPMIHWTIRAALESAIFDYVMVSTDSEAIAEISRASGAQVPFLRDAADADDHTPVWVATTNALIQLEPHISTQFDVVVQLMPNCPLRNGDDIVDAHRTFTSQGTDFQISVFKFGWMNPWWAMSLNKEGMQPRQLFPEAFHQRSQDQEALYCPTGAIWIAWAQELKKQRTFYGEGYTVCPMNWKNAIDIDDAEDLEMARVISGLDWK